MAYEKKIEPIAAREVFWAGLTLQLWVIFYIVLPWVSFGSDCEDIMFKGELNSEDDVTQFHNCIKKHRAKILTGCVFLMIGYPILVSHLYFYLRITTVLMAAVDTGLSQFMYTSSWAICGTVFCTISPALGIFIGYYDWEFASGDEYMGYALQFQFWHYWLILTDCAVIPLGLAVATPHIRSILILLGYCKSKHYKFSDEARDNMYGNITRIKCGKYGVICVLLFTSSICIFGAIGDALDFAKDGFFSYHGGSQFLSIMIVFAMEFHVTVMFTGYCKFDQTMNDILDNVQQVS